MSDILLDQDAQKLYIEAMLGNPTLFAKVQHLVKPSYFDGVFQDGIEFIQEFFAEHRTIPSLPVFKTNTKLEYVEPTKLPDQDLKYVSEQIAGFCQIKAVTEAVLAAPALIAKNDLGLMVNQIKAATEVQLHSDLGLEYFENVLLRLELTESNESLISTGWRAVDDLIGGGIGRQELILFAANSGGGKSVAMLNLSNNLLKNGLNGVYISLEMRDTVVAKRLDSMITRISARNASANKAKIDNEVTTAKENGYGRFFIKRMREGTTSASDIISYLHELDSVHAFKPDFVVIDYLDLMSPMQKIKNDNVFFKDKLVSEEIRGIGFDFNCVVISASQLGRCLALDTDILMRDLSIKKLSELEIGDELLNSTSDGYQTVYAKTAPEKKKGYKITLEDGKTIICSGEHRFPSWDGPISINDGLGVGDILFTI